MGRGPSIEGRKSVEDSKRAKVFTKLIREITVAARAGADTGGNPRLRLAVDRALSANMPKDTIERAIKRGSGAEPGQQMEEMRYEGYGPGGVAIMIDCVTDNPTRTVAEVRNILAKHGGHLGTTGSVSFQFSSRGEITFDLPTEPSLEEKILGAALEAGADDVQNQEQSCIVVTTPQKLQAVSQALQAAGLVARQSTLVMRPASLIVLDSVSGAPMKALLERLDELDDVQSVHHNAVFSDTARTRV